MSQFFIGVTDGELPPDVPTAISVDSGANIVPQANEFEIHGFQVRTSASQVTETFNTGDNLTVRIADQTFTTQYVVDSNTTPGAAGTYSTIQSAVNAVVTDGWVSATGQGVVLVRSNGVGYTENINIPANCNIAIIGLTASGSNGSGAKAVNIIGSITLNSGTLLVLSDITLTPPSSTLGIILNTGASRCYILNSFLDNSVSGTSIIQVNGDTRALIAVNCYIAGVIQLSSTSSAFDFTRCASFYSCYITSQASFAGSGKAAFYGCTMAGVTLAGTSAVALYNCDTTGDIEGASTGSCVAYSSAFIAPSTGSTFFNNSSGTIEYANCSASYGSNLYSSSISKKIDSSSQGNVINSVKTATSYTVKTWDYYIGVTSTASPRTITLPAPSTISIDQSFIIKDESINAGVNNITIATAAGNIDGSSTVVINTSGGSYTVKSDGTNYFII